VTLPICVPSRSAASSGVITTYSPVMNPDTLAGVWASPVVCRICATPYSPPSTSAYRRASGDSRWIARGATSSIATDAIANRTARKSATGTRSRRSWIR
jgi:hypothetical protein